jgi:hypothetical protein
MTKKRHGKRGSKRRKIDAVKTRGVSLVTVEAVLPLDSYEEWLKRQTIKPAEPKAEIQVSTDSYEEWLRKRVKKYLTNREAVVSISFPPDKAFYFYSEVGSYTGMLAPSIQSFIEVLSKVGSQSLEFHLYRRDFELWIENVVQAPELAENIGGLRREGLKGEVLRQELIKVIKDWRVKKASEL